MSALGQKQTLGHLRLMSALPPKADIGTHSWNVCFVPIAGITNLSGHGEVAGFGDGRHCMMETQFAELFLPGEKKRTTTSY